MRRSRLQLDTKLLKEQRKLPTRIASATALVNYAEADADEESDEEREDPEAVVVGATGEAVDDFMAEVDAIFKEKESKADDWKEVRDAKGQIYFVHSRTGETAWTRPAVKDEQSGKEYYWNKFTGKTRWEPPASLKKVEVLADEKTQLKELLDVIDTKLATNRADSDEWTAFGIELQIRKEDADDLGVDRKWLLKRVRGLQQRVERSWRPTRKTALVRCYDAKAGIYAYTDPDSQDFCSAAVVPASAEWKDVSSVLLDVKQSASFTPEFVKELLDGAGCQLLRVCRCGPYHLVLNFADESACTKALGALGVQHDAQQCASWTESRDGGVRVRYVNHLDLPDASFPCAVDDQPARKKQRWDVK